MTPRFATVAPVVAALAIVGLAREAWFHVVAERAFSLPEGQLERIDPRYAAARAYFAPGARVGYVSDEKVDTEPGPDPTNEAGLRLYQQAQYALAPVVLRYQDDRAPRVFANLRDPARLEALARGHRLRVVARLGPDLAVLEPAP